ncbi:MAG: branched-chain amino acid transport system II carrier protein, partial [Parachlamydiaceae bacterium]
KKNQIVDILGYYLTPLLLLSLAIIIVKGIIFSPSAPSSDLMPIDAFSLGFFQGYQTMDLLGAFFFSSVVIACLKPEQMSQEGKHRRILKLMGQASIIGAVLLSLIYIGFSYVSAFNAESLVGTDKDKILGQASLLILGPTAGILSSIAVALACLTTAIALACVFAEFLHHDITFGKVGYIPSLIITLLISYFVSIMNFNQIVAFLAPILEILYPALIVLALMNILYKLYDVKAIKVPVLAALAATLLFKYFI